MRIAFWITFAVMACSSMGFYFGESTVTHVEITDSTVTVFHRQESNWLYANGERPPATVWKDIYKVRNGKIVKDTSINASVTPEHTVPEKVQW